MAYNTGSASSGGKITFDVYSNRPISGNVGDMFIPTNGPVSFVYSGTVWQPLIQGSPGTQVPLASTWTAYGSQLGLNDIAGTLDVSIGVVSHPSPLCGKTQPLGSPSHVNIMAFQYFPQPGGGSFGMFVTDGTKAITYQLIYQTSGICLLSVDQYATSTSAAVNQFAMNLPGGISGNVIWLRIGQTAGFGGVRDYGIILGGEFGGIIADVYQEPEETFLTETAVGVVMTAIASPNQGQGNIATLQSFFTGP